MSGNLLTDNPRLHEARFPGAGRLAGRRAEDHLRRHGAGTRVLGRAVTGADLSEAALPPARNRYLASCRRILVPGGPLVAAMRNGACFLGRTRVRTTDDGAPPVARRSAWRPLFPWEQRHVRTAHGFEVLDLQDGPGPRTQPARQQGESPRTTADGDRPHLLARPHTTR
ncbi:hypothetical protein SLINC_6484 [Streptomyces lincolnensis]|uniref:Uncharacterized protein n=1 Tax=Streptomyces lincolnensis TaxID=1915 RepID=A0A1B1MJD7_STRLN|nr:hypothetical protein [Streptomyces lincolnensis]ANS68708.1 hypothetical protein SLINC_6484 [Streptomyces lincolnensis]AXG53086.1 hypothetical protein SLCG_1931 [Streptomyces lincolnensis]QMV10317.1 hypothetical protein GJU35_34780 [Streptomyces lincolnensis]